jgi:FkbM family methyltransferase
MCATIEMSKLRSRVGRLLRGVLSPWDLTVVPIDRVAGGAALVIDMLARLGIDLVLDVGANDGATGKWLRERGYRGRIVSFEPQSDVFRALEKTAEGDARWECRRLALGAVDGARRMKVSGFSPSSSLLPMRDEHIEVWPESRPVGDEEVQVARLDGLAAELQIASHRTLLKADVQGYEMEVLKGAGRVLQQIEAAYFELLFAPFYEGQSEYFEVMATLERSGLRFSGLYEDYPDPSSHLPLFANGLFLRAAPEPARDGQRG